MKYAVSVLQRASDDADRIFEWIAAKSPQGAINWHIALKMPFCSLRPARTNSALHRKAMSLKLSFVRNSSKLVEGAVTVCST
jgi:hypothetical protein